jgi:hypothetical protein
VTVFGDGPPSDILATSALSTALLASDNGKSPIFGLILLLRESGPAVSSRPSQFGEASIGKPGAVLDLPQLSDQVYVCMGTVTFELAEFFAKLTGLGIRNRRTFEHSLHLLRASLSGRNLSVDKWIESRDSLQQIAAGRNSQPAQSSPFSIHSGPYPKIFRQIDKLQSRAEV